jgi:hypothetical protein
VNDAHNCKQMEQNLPQLLLFLFSFIYSFHLVPHIRVCPPKPSSAHRSSLLSSRLDHHRPAQSVDRGTEIESTLCLLSALLYCTLLFSGHCFQNPRMVTFFFFFFFLDHHLQYTFQFVANCSRCKSFLLVRDGSTDVQ